jgi:hypothetical protein
MRKLILTCTGQLACTLGCAVTCLHALRLRTEALENMVSMISIEELAA